MDESLQAREYPRRKDHTNALFCLRWGIGIAVALVFLIGFLLILISSFKVKTLTVEGTSFYTEEKILEVAGIREGDELYSIDKRAVIQKILNGCPYLQKVSVQTSFPSSVKIVVTENPVTLYTSYGEYYLSFTPDFRVLEVSTDEAQFATFIKTELPDISSVTQKGGISFSDGVPEHLGTLLDFLDEAGILRSVTAIDCSDRYGVSYTLEDRCTVKVGKVSDLLIKTELAGEILLEKGGIGGARSVIDVSDVRKATYREIVGA